MAERSKQVSARNVISSYSRSQWLQAGASIVLLGWFALIVWGMLASFDLANLSGKLLNLSPSGALRRIFTVPDFGALAWHGLLLLAATWLTLLAGALGVWLGHLLGLHLGSESPLLGLAMAAALGYAGACLLFTTLNLAGLLYGWLVWAITLAWSAATLGWLWQRRGLLDWWRRHTVAAAIRYTIAGVRRPQHNFVAMLLIFAAASSIILALATALAPPVLYDTMLYHLAMPRQYVAHNGFVPVLAEMVIMFAQGMEFIYTWPLALFGGDNWSAGSIAAVMHWQMGVITTFAVYGFCRVLRLSPVASLLAAATFIAQPLVNRVIGTAYVDAGTAFFTILCLYALYRWWQNERTGWLTAAAILAGTATAVKLFGGPLIVLMLLVIATKWWQQRPVAGKSRPLFSLNFIAAIPRRNRGARLLEAQSTTPHIYIRLGLVGMIIAVLVASYSYIASWLVLGNPIWPLANNFFGGWNSAVADANYKQLVSYLFNSVDQGPSQLNFGEMLKYMFWNLWVDKASDMRGGMMAPRTLPITTALLPGILMIGGIALWRWWSGSREPEREPDHTDPALWWGFAYAFLFIIFWFFVQGQRRYILFTLPLLAAACGWLYERLRRKLPLVAWGYVAFLVITLYTATMSNLAFNFRAFSNVYGLLPDRAYVLEGAVVRLGEGGQTMMYLNRIAPKDKAVLLTELTAPLYYLGRDYLLTNPGWDDFLNYATLKTADDFRQRLDAYNISYLVDMRDQNYLTPLLQAGMWQGRNQFMHLVYTQGNWYTYQRDAQAVASGLNLNAAGRIGVIGFDGGLPSDLTGAINLDGLDRIKPNTLRSIDTIVVKQHVSPVERTNFDSIAVYAPDATTIEQRLARTAQLVSSNDDYHAYNVRGRDLLPIFGQQPIPLDPSTVRLSQDESGEAQVSSSSNGISLTLPLTTTHNGPTTIKLDRQGADIPGVSATLELRTPSIDVRDKPVLLADIEVSSGAMVGVTGDVNGVSSYLLWKFNGSGDGVADQIAIYLPPGAQRLANLRFILQAPQGGTGNSVGGKLVTNGGQSRATLVLKSLSVFSQ